jgi:acyl-CoA dehydrogenase
MSSTAGRGGSHSYVVYRGARIPRENLVGRPGDGFLLAQKRLGGGRIHHAMRLLGQSQRAFEMMCERAVSRSSHGQVLRDHQFVQDHVAESAVGIETARLLTLKAAWTMDTRGESASRAEISMIKYWGAKVALDVIDRAIQLHGSLGYTTEMPLEAMYRHARALRIADGADEVHKVTIARAVLKGARPVEGWPSEWIPARREAAIRKFQELLDLHVDNL